MPSNDQFDKIIEAITEKYEAAVKTTLDQSNIVDLKGFYKVYHDEEKATDDECTTLAKKSPKLELFSEVFKILEVHPANLQKPKPKAPTVRDRLNSTISKSSPSLNDLSLPANSSGFQKDSSSISLNITKMDDVVKPSETYKSFVKFQKQLKQANLEIEQQKTENDYAGKLKQLRNFSQQLEKLLPSEKVGQSALTREEELILENLVSKMDNLNFIRANQGIFREQNNTIFNNTHRLDNLVDILSHCLTAANSFNIN